MKVKRKIHKNFQRTLKKSDDSNVTQNKPKLFYVLGLPIILLAEDVLQAYAKINNSIRASLTPRFSLQKEEDKNIIIVIRVLIILAHVLSSLLSL